jgi:hypothetical protein
VAQRDVAEASRRSGGALEHNQRRLQGGLHARARRSSQGVLLHEHARAGTASGVRSSCPRGAQPDLSTWRLPSRLPPCVLCSAVIAGVGKVSIRSSSNRVTFDAHPRLTWKIWRYHPWRTLCSTRQPD